jgi:hypothetical protein
MLMNRREALRLLMMSTALSLVPRNLMALREARMFLATPAAPGMLNAHQRATVSAMAEMILPRTETPGATDVGVTEFINLILTEWYDDAQRDAFLNGLADVDTRTRTLFGKDFVASSTAQQEELLAALGEKMAEEARDQPRQARGLSAEPDKNFYFMLRHLTLTAYYTSEAGATTELHFEVIPDRHAACVEMQPGKESPTTSEQ